MQDNILKIKELWHYLRLLDRTLIVQAYNSERDMDQYYVAKHISDHIDIQVHDSMPDIEIGEGNEYLIIRQRGADGRFEIPDALDIQIDIANDY